MAKWVGIYIIDLIFWLWVLNYGGAKVWFVRLFALPIVYLFKFEPKDEEQAVRLIAYITIVGHTIVFLIGLFNEPFRLQATGIFF